MNTSHKKKHPPRIRFLRDDEAALWHEGQTGDDLGPEYPGSSSRVLRLDHFDELVVLDDPYGRQLIERFGDDDILDPDDVHEPGLD